MTNVADAIPGSRVVERPSGSLAEQVDAVAALVGVMVGDDGPWVAAGVSGGATLALALALAGLPERVVIHEPLVGRHAPSLHAAVSASSAALAAGTLDVDGWYAGLVGSDAWAALPAARRDAALARHPDLLTEITPFVTWNPPSLSAPVPIHTTVGGSSGPARHEAAAALAAAGATVEVLADCGHLAQLDAPAAFAEAVLR